MLVVHSVFPLGGGVIPLTAAAAVAAVLPLHRSSHHDNNNMVPHSVTHIRFSGPTDPLGKGRQANIRFTLTTKQKQVVTQKQM